MRPPGGLGRGLAGILDQSQDGIDSTAVGLQQLLGDRSATIPPRVRQFVVDTALDAIADSFEAEAVVVVRREEGSTPVTVSSRFPASWDDGSAARFELFGQLWNLLDEEPTEAETVEGVDHGRAWWRMLGLGDNYLWLARQDVEAGRLAAAVVRAKPLNEPEQISLTRLIRSVASAVGAAESAKVSAETLHVQIDEPIGRAELTVNLDDARRTAWAEAATPELAVATAATYLVDASVQVMFAGRTDLDGAVVSIVVLAEVGGAPLIGLSIAETVPFSGIADAVFSAVGS